MIEKKGKKAFVNSWQFKHMKKIAVVIPAYNEEKSIASVVEQINELKIDGFRFTPIVVNDASEDSTVKIASKLHCVLIDLAVNIGIGGTVQSGFIYAFQNGFDYAMQVDGDGQHPAEEIPRLLEDIDDFDMVTGARTKKGYKGPKKLVKAKPKKVAKAKTAKEINGKKKFTMKG